MLLAKSKKAIEIVLNKVKEAVSDVRLTAFLDELPRKKLFNPEGKDRTSSIVGDDITNVLDTVDMRYPWAKKIWDTMLSNSWIPETVSMLKDVQDLTKLSPVERTALLKILSFLIYLDSIQTNNISNIANYITAPEVVLTLARQTFEEALHSSSYSHILNCLFTKEEANLAINYWREDEILLSRNKEIAEIYQRFIDTPTMDNFILACVANYLLENVYFYNGFNFFWSLAARGVLLGTCAQIKYINRDELTHGVLFRQIILAIQEERPEEWERNLPKITEMFTVVAEHDIVFFKHTISGILGITDQTITDYTHYLVNKRAKELRLPTTIYEDVANPYVHLERLSGIEDDTTSKTNVFEGSSVAYRKTNAIGGWDLISTKLS